MNCEQVRPWLGALLDGELDVRTAAEVQAHMADCSSCKAAYRTDAALHTKLRSAGLHFEVSDALRDRVMSQFESAAAAPSVARGRPTRSHAGVLRLLLWSGWALALALFVLNLRGGGESVDDELIALHVRSLLADHLSDVTSADRHTVKPWFAGRLDFAPPVPDLTDRGFTLVGGRLDYLDTRKVAALVYRRRAHVINVVVGPSDGHPQRRLFPFNSSQRALTRRGFSLRRWQASGLSFSVISDINPAELESFEQAYVSKASG